ncbi:MAG: hypothetical protein HC778_00545 [Chamaesiphon sp. CSU_1_12]|nr:hypothetical protein [Chamaesiphon sp. CSU_1_12]
MPVAAKAAVVAPAITPLVGYADAIKIEDLSDGVVQITAYLPQATAAKLIGSTVQKTLEITPTNATPLLWVGAKASNVPESVTTLPATLEEYFLNCASNAINLGFDAGSITTENRLLGGTVKTCTKVSLKVQRDGSANYSNPDLQLATVGYYNAADGGGGYGSEPISSPS